MQVAEQLLESGYAYQYDEGVIRFRIVPGTKITFQDRVQGNMTMRSDDLEEYVLVRSNGQPTYMLSASVDDHDSNVTHVIRGQDHITNTFKQILLLNALGWNLPVYAHIPLIYSTDGEKLSKRVKSSSVQEYQAAGILPNALCN